MGLLQHIVQEELQGTRYVTAYTNTFVKMCIQYNMQPCILSSFAAVFETLKVNMAKNMWKRRAGWRDREFYPWLVTSSATMLATAAITGACCVAVPGAIPASSWKVNHLRRESLSCRTSCEREAKFTEADLLRHDNSRFEAFELFRHPR